MKSVSLITGGLSFLLSACSGGGGSFDVDDVSNPSSSKPRYQDDTSSSRTKSKLENLSIPSLGGGMKLVAQNIHPKSSKEPSLLNDYVVLTGLSSIRKDIESNKNGGTPIGSIDEPNATNPNENDHGQKYVYSGLYYIESWRLIDSSKNKYYAGYYGYAYYFGKQTATTLPVDGVATYKGTWDFITATKNGKTYPLLKNSGNQAYAKRSAIPTDIDLEDTKTGLTSEFSADFGKKKLTGQLYYNLRKTNANESQGRKHKLYDIDADIYSNRFRGKVDPAQKDSTEHPFTSEGVLEGGFYGPNAEELGGKFLANDKRVFGVFSAKEDPENQKLSKETLIDGKLITFKRTDATTSTTTNTAASTTTDAKTDEKNFTTKDIPSFGEADYLLIDDQPIPLLPEEKTSDFITSRHHTVGNKRYKVEACCSNLSYVKFGMYYEDPLKEKETETEKDKEKDKQTTTTSINTYYQFLLGHRTASSKIPATGNVKYHGSWFGYISDGTTSYSTSGDIQRDKNALAEFTVDFDTKKLTGKLKRHDTGNTVFSIDADFKNRGNAFTGTATANNVAIDSQSTQGTSNVNFTATVNGAFYGPNASELGGYFTYNGKNPTATNSESSPAVSSSSNSEKARAAVVFGAKQQVETTK
ncbi:transferrin-binding protein-like solute binding protein [Haemophilus influenzae]|uniref:transferrin-binding protein-like solute binding protein n=1 Tax=Haemophilus influenzae TaxID=727 RepID=UPI001AEA0BAB|nr:transferrin-binding protein-like solute binding protein [Haemophilus influenzae]